MKKVGIIAGFAAAAAAALLGASLVVTYPNEYKLIRQFGEIVRVVETPGVSFRQALRRLVCYLETPRTIPRQKKPPVGHRRFAGQFRRPAVLRACDSGIAVVVA